MNDTHTPPPPPLPHPVTGVATPSGPCSHGGRCGGRAAHQHRGMSCTSSPPLPPSPSLPPLCVLWLDDGGMVVMMDSGATMRASTDKSWVAFVITAFYMLPPLRVLPPSLTPSSIPPPFLHRQPLHHTPFRPPILLFRHTHTHPLNSPSFHPSLYSLLSARRTRTLACLTGRSQRRRRPRREGKKAQQQPPIWMRFSR